MKTKLTKLETRMENIKKVGYKLFLEKGYENTSFKDIIKVSGGSYSSIYDKYKNKENFFRAIFEEKMELTFFAFEDKMKKSFHLNLRDFLVEFAKEFLHTIEHKRHVQAYRLVMSVSYQNPSIQQWLSSKSEFALFKVLAKYFENCSEIKDGFEGSYTMLAKTFCACLKNYLFTEKLVLGAKDLKGDELLRYIDFIINIFLFGVKK